MPSPANLFLGMLFGAIGVGYFIYGRKQMLFTPLLCGLALMVYPWFVGSTFWLAVIGVVLCAIPWLVRH